ncbi:MAG: peptide ABC transporter substrate-binding protein [Clostridia bacterium]|nr:peptide ABC transporter substrate-binding protein [Clostridia bacterium]
MKKRISLALVFVLMLCVFTAGASATAENSGEKIAVYNIGVFDETLDPCERHTTASVNMYINLNGYLYRLNLKGEWEPELAEGYTISDDGLVWTVSLKPGLVFSSGNPITAEDVVYSWTRAADPYYASEYAFILYYIKGMEAFNMSLEDDSPLTYEEAMAEVGLKVLDDLTVEITLENPTPFFDQMLGYNTYAVIDKVFCESVDEFGSSPETISTAGPFVVAEWKKDEYILAKKNENYYDADNVKLDGVKFTFVQNVGTELTLFETGEVDLTNLEMSTADMMMYEAQGILRSFQTLGTGWLAYNCTTAPYDDVKVRQALVMALDQDSICRTVIGGGVAPADGFIPLSMPSAANPSEPFRTVSYIDVHGNVEEAQKLLAEAGYPGGEGFPAGFLSYGVTSDRNRAISEAMCAMWKTNLGIDISPDGQESRARLDNRMSGNFDITFQGWGADMADPTTFLDCMLSNHFYNYGKYDNPAFDEAMKNAALNGGDPVARTEYLREAERILMEDMPVIMFQFSTKVYLQADRLVDVVASPLAIFDLKWADLP